MAKSNKLLMKLIKASGGWENFLYETLRELCKDVTGLYSVDGIDREVQLAALVEEVMEVLETYGEVRRGKIPLEESIANLEPPIKPAVPIPIQAALPIAPQVVKTAVATPALEKPRKRSARVSVDREAGWCQGELPIPAGYRIVNKDKLLITTVNGMILAQGSEDGQVRGQDVSGQISNYGKYRLVFKEVSIGSGLINYEIMPQVELPPAPPRSEVPMTPAMVAAIRAAQAGQPQAVPVDPPRPEGGVKEVG